MPEVENNWNALVQTLEDHSSSVNAVAFLPDGKLLVSVSDDNTVELWDVSSGAVLWTLEGHLDWITAVAFSPYCKLLASASHDNTVKIWDAGSGTELQTLEVDKVRTLSFSDDGAFLQTDRGPLYTAILSNCTATSLPDLPPSVSVKDQWVSRGRESILWLPSEHRQSRAAIHGSTIALGYPSGRISFIEFAF
jgi:WD40 repeat protein